MVTPKTKTPRKDANKPIRTGTYSPAMPEWAGWVEDKDSTWILFYAKDGSALFYAKRDKNGGVIEPGIPTATRRKTKEPQPSGQGKEGAL